MEPRASSPSAFPAAYRHILAGAIDYAGLFPPASLGMADAVANYAEYRAGDDAWALGRFVLPIGRLDEFAAAAATVLSSVDADAPWRLSALVDPGTPAQLKALHDFHETSAGRAVVDSVEGKAATVEAVTPYGRFREAGLDVFVEIPLDAELPPLLHAVAETGLSAKIRTGGITPEAIPSPRAVAAFLVACRDAGAPFKATAGLHHPIRGDYRLTYAPDSPTGVMFGYLNVMLAAALAWSGAPKRTIERMLDERDSSAIVSTAGGLQWRDHAISLDAIDTVREFFVCAFGSCSFREPLDDLTALLRR